ncbi:cell wall biogenesis and architecture protein [Paramarasmius palmivorus]|uniref:3-methyl-2-oxobutanoate hydroxymethyltransferase n=1 Tax=Paramarasmius palmivorus TaxID=297713 RepID=A0AAW0DK10_9AGAR
MLQARHTIFRFAQRAHDWRRCMSVRPQSPNGCHAPNTRRKVTIETLYALKAKRTPISMITAYDYPAAVACSSNPLVDIILVGDSLAQVCLGYASTTELTLAEMMHHTRAVARGTTHPFLVADMPFGTYMSSTEDAVRNAVRLVQEGRVEGIKMEGGLEIVETVRRLTAFGIPVMAHVGLKPQRHVACSGFRIQGKCVDGAQQILDEAQALEDAGAFSIVLEGIPKELGQCITERLKIPTIGIGAGPLTDGQVLVWDDVMGTWSGHKAKFARAFGNVKSERDSAIQQYVEAVKNKSFPTEEESYTSDKIDWGSFRETNLRSH